MSARFALNQSYFGSVIGNMSQYRDVPRWDFGDDGLMCCRFRLCCALVAELRCDEGYIAKLPMIQIDPRLTAVTQHLAQKTLDDFQQLLQTMKPKQAVARSLSDAFLGGDVGCLAPWPGFEAYGEGPDAGAWSYRGKE